MATLIQKIEQVLGQPVIPIHLNGDDFALFRALYPDPRGMIDAEKLVEYYISYRWLNFNKQDIYMDVAAQDCPFAFYIQKEFHCKVYRQDLYHFSPGIHGTDIGCDATSIPLRDHSLTKVSLHNSIEHFENDSDSGLIHEMARLIRPGGKMLINPLFIQDQYTIETDAGWVDEKGEKHLWGEGARFSRLYDPERFKSRILDHASGFNIKFYFIQNGQQVDRDIYAHFFAIFEKT